MKQIIKKLVESKGNIAIIFCVALLPLSLLFFNLATDISIILSESQKTKKILDSALIAAMNQSKKPSQIETTLNQIIRRSNKKLTATLNQEQYSTQGVLAADIELKVNSMILNWLKEDQTLSFNVHSEAQIIPSDVSIYIDGSSYMAPNAYNNDKFENSPEIWHPPTAVASQWPPSKFINRYAEHFKLFEEVMNKGNLLRSMTQQCHNSVLTAMKETGIRLADYFLGLPQNSVGVLMGPNINNGISYIKEVNTESLDTRGAFENYFSPRSSDSLCFGISEYSEDRRANYEGNYALPRNGKDDTDKQSNVKLINNTTLGFKNNVQNNLTARKIIWNRSIRYSNNGTEFEGVDIELARVLTQVANSIFGAKINKDLEYLDHLKKRIGIIILGKLPKEFYIAGRENQDVIRDPIYLEATAKIGNSLIEINEQAKKANMRLTYFITTSDRSYIQSDCLNIEDEAHFYCVNYRVASEHFEEFILRVKQKHQLNNIDLTFIKSHRYSFIPHDLLSLLPNSSQGVMLRK